jgi:ketosteroid isomerase-like protein
LRPNVQLVARLYDAFRSRDVPGVLALLAEDISIEQSTEVPWGGSYRGHDGAMQFFATLGGAITSAVTIDHYVDAGDQVVAVGWTRGTVNANGAAFDVPIAHVWQLRGGRAVAVRFCIDNPTMRTALDAPKP